MPEASVFRVCDDAGVNCIAWAGSELTESNYFRSLKRCPYIRPDGVDSAVLPLFMGTRGLEGPNAFRFGLRKAPHAVGSDRAEGFCGQPTLKRWPDDLHRGGTQPPTCRGWGEKLFRGSRATFLLKPSDPFGWSRNYSGVSANEKPDSTIAAELSMRCNDDAGTLQRRSGHAEIPRPVRDYAI